MAWQWTVSYPLGHNPNNDDPGGPLGAATDLSRLGNIGGGVFMLAGSSVNGTAGVTRNIEIPTGKPVFIPILTVEWSTAETGHTTFADLLADNKATIADMTGMHCILDGNSMSLADIFSHEEISPLYQFNLPDNNVLGVPATTSPTNSVADGFWVMTRPLSQGVHTVDFGGSFDFGGGSTFSFETKDTLYVVPQGQYNNEPVNAATLAAVQAAESQPSLPFEPGFNGNDQRDWVAMVLDGQGS